MKTKLASRVVASSFTTSALLCVLATSVSAQEVQWRLQSQRARTSMQRAQRKSNARAALAQRPRQPRWVVVAQFAPGLGGAPQNTYPAEPPVIAAPDETTGTTPQTGDSTATSSGTTTTAKKRSSPEISFFYSSAIGFDNGRFVRSDPVPREIDVKRRVYNASVTGEYPLANNTSFYVSLPYIYQTTLSTSQGNTTRETGRGLGDITLYLDRNFPGIAKGTDLSVSLGLGLPTGKAFNLEDDELATGNGFYEPLISVRLDKMLIPVRFYIGASYGTSLARRIDGETTKLPPSYGGEIGFYYTLGPEFTTRTGLSIRKTSSPFLFEPGSTTGYLSQAITYSASNGYVVRGALDVGLTDDSTDTYLNLSVYKRF